MSSEIDQRLSELMKRAQDGDRLAYETLLSEVAILVRNFVRKRVQKWDWQEEIVQETLLCIHRDRHTYHPERPFRPWMYAIARHRLFDQIEKQRRWSELELLTNAGAMASPGTGVESASSWRFVREALAHLSKRQREVIQLLKLEGFSVAEISSKTGLTASTVKITAHRGYMKLRALLREPGS